MHIIPAYVYKIVHKETGQFYIGYRYANIKQGILPEDDILINYFTSSNKVKDIILKEGTDIFVSQILFKHPDNLVCWVYEQLIIRDNWNDLLILNGKYHDPDSDIEVKRRIGFHSESTKIKMSMAGKGRPKSEEHKRKISVANTGKIGSDTKRHKISKASVNTVVAFDKITNKKVKITKEEFDNFPERYSGNTIGKVSAYDMINHSYVSLPKEEFAALKDIRYVGVNSKKIPKKS